MKQITSANIALTINIRARYWQCREESENLKVAPVPFPVCFTPSKEGRFWSLSFASWILVFCLLMASVLMESTHWKHSHKDTKAAFLLSTTDMTVCACLGALVPGKTEAQWFWREGASCESACSLIRLRDVGQWWWGGCGGARPVWLASIWWRFLIFWCLITLFP